MTAEKVHVTLGPDVEHPLLEGGEVLGAPSGVVAQNLGGVGECEALGAGTEALVGRTGYLLTGGCPLVEDSHGGVGICGLVGEFPEQGHLPGGTGVLKGPTVVFGGTAAAIYDFHRLGSVVYVDSRAVGKVGELGLDFGRAVGRCQEGFDPVEVGLVVHGAGVAVGVYALHVLVLLVGGKVHLAVFVFLTGSGGKRGENKQR